MVAELQVFGDGSEGTYSYDCDVEWSPDGRYLAYIGHLTVHIWDAFNETKLCDDLKALMLKGYRVLKIIVW